MITIEDFKKIALHEDWFIKWVNRLVDRNTIDVIDNYLIKDKLYSKAIYLNYISDKSFVSPDYDQDIQRLLVRFPTDKGFNFVSRELRELYQSLHSTLFIDVNLQFQINNMGEIIEKAKKKENDVMLKLKAKGMNVPEHISANRSIPSEVQAYLDELDSDQMIKEHHLIFLAYFNLLIHDLECEFNSIVDQLIYRDSYRFYNAKVFKGHPFREFGKEEALRQSKENMLFFSSIWEDKDFFSSWKLLLKPLIEELDMENIASEELSEKYENFLAKCVANKHECYSVIKYLIVFISYSISQWKQTNSNGSDDISIRWSRFFTPELLLKIIEIRETSTDKSTVILEKTSRYYVEELKKKKGTSAMAFRDLIKYNRACYSKFSKLGVSQIVIKIQAEDIQPWFKELANIDDRYRAD